MLLHLAYETGIPPSALRKESARDIIGLACLLSEIRRKQQRESGGKQENIIYGDG